VIGTLCVIVGVIAIYLKNTHPNSVGAGRVLNEAANEATWPDGGGVNSRIQAMLPIRIAATHHLAPTGPANFLFQAPFSRHGRFLSTLIQ
jgi:hypothetical protein